MPKQNGNMSINEDMAVVDRIFEQTKNNPNYDWNQSSFAGLKNKPFVHISVIKTILGKLALRFAENNSKNPGFSGFSARNVQILVHWINRMLAQENFSDQDEIDLENMEHSLGLLECTGIKNEKVYTCMADICMNLSFLR